MGIEIFKMAFGILGMIFSVGFLILILRKPIKDSKLQILAMGKGAAEGIKAKVTTSKGIKTNTNDDEDDTNLLDDEKEKLEEDTGLLEEETDILTEGTGILEDATGLLIEENTELLSFEEEGEQK